MTQPDKQSILYNLEKDIVNLLLDKLEKSDITPERASVIAKFIIAHIPQDISDDKLLQIIPSLDDQFLELAGIVLKYLKTYQEKEEHILKQSVHELIQSGHFDEASNLMKGYFNKILI